MKRYLQPLISLMFLLSVFIPVSFAADNVNIQLDVFHENLSDVQEVDITTLPNLEEAYRLYSEVAESEGKFVTLSLEEFIWNYNETTGEIDEYLTENISAIDSLLDLDAIIFQEEEIDEQLATQMDSQNITPLSTLQWWHNKSIIDQATTYGSTYNLLGKAIRGDIVYESAGGFGITGHTAIVAGSYWSSTYSQYYIRCVEAISSGVCYGILCDTRFSQQKSYLDRPTAPTTTQMKAAVAFAESQVGKSYSLLASTADLSSSRSNWYCSLLAYASYNSQGISLCTLPSSGYLMPSKIHSGNVQNLVSY